jgi:hypothetical protein
MARNDKPKSRTMIGSEIKGDVKPLRAALAHRDSRLLSTLVWGIFVLVFSLISITTSLQKSPTVDEPLHLFSGYSHLKWGDFRANPEHPPLGKVLATFPLLFLEIKDPRPLAPEWDLIPTKGPVELRTVIVAAQMIFGDNEAKTLFFYGKLMMIALAIVLGLFAYKWS